MIIFIKGLISDKKLNSANAFRILSFGEFAVVVLKTTPSGLPAFKSVFTLRPWTRKLGVVVKIYLPMVPISATRINQQL